MNKKGFTLAELLGVVIIMGLIILVVVTPILSQVRKQSNKIDDLTQELLYSTVETYLEKNAAKYIKDPNKTYYISLGLLVEHGLLDKNFLNKYNAETLSADTVIKVTNENDVFNYEIMDISSYSTLGQIEKGIEGSKYSFMNGTYNKNTVTNGYVLYNNILHQILGRNEDGNIKIMSVESVTKLIAGNSTQTYSNSYVRNWLNTNYYSSLSDKDYIAKSNWCVDSQSSPVVKTDCNNTIEDYVGLITTMEISSREMYSDNFYNSSYLSMTQQNIGRFYNMDQFSCGASSANYSFNIRPVVNLLPSTIILSGNGSINNPYVLLNNDNDTYENVRLKDAYLSIGQYLKYNNNNYRLMEIGSGYLKLVYVPGEVDLTTSVFSTSSNRFNLNNGIGYLLNTTLRSTFIPTDENLNLTLDSKVYLGEYATEGSDYNSSYLMKTNQLANTIAGVSKLGELFGSTPYKCYTASSCPTYWLMTDANTSSAYSISTTAIVAQSKSESYSVIPTIYIDNNGYILSGAGTSSNPFILGGK